MAERTIDRIEYDGNTYKFIDQEARDLNTSFSNRLNNFSTNVSESVGAERGRAEAAEQALEASFTATTNGLSAGKVDKTSIVSSATITQDGKLMDGKTCSQALASKMSISSFALDGTTLNITL